MIEADDELRAYHEAGHAVAMWKLGFGIRIVSIEPEGDLGGYAEPALEYDEPDDADVDARRFMVEQTVLYLHAGDVAARLLRPDAGLGQAQTDHKRVHERMYTVEDDGAVHITWCNHLWQRAYHLLAWPGQWYLVAGLAQQLLRHRTLGGAEAQLYLRKAGERLQYDPLMPNAVLIGEVTYVCSPWHRQWHQQSSTAVQKPKRTDLPGTIAALNARCRATRKKLS